MVVYFNLVFGGKGMDTEPPQGWCTTTAVPVVVWCCGGLQPPQEAYHYRR